MASTSLPFLVLLCAVASSLAGTALDDYVRECDDTYHWSLYSTAVQSGYTVYVINMTSQTWRAGDSDRPVWTHWMSICVPNQIYGTPGVHTAFLYIDGGTNGNPARPLVPFVEGICLVSGTVTVHLEQVPNQFITFNDDGIPRTEDSLIAYTWNKFLNTSDGTWPLRMPMTKAAVRAMDTIETFVDSLEGVPSVKDFTVSGASKRAWAAYTTAIVDSRVVALIPLVLPILNMVPNLNHAYRSLGEWSWVLNDYFEFELFNLLNHPKFKLLTDLLDPISYRNRLTMPKLIVSAFMDEFFMPDAHQFFLSQLRGETQLYLVADANHPLTSALSRVVSDMALFHLMVMNDIPRPEYTYELVRSNTTAKIIVKTNTEPSQVNMWWVPTFSTEKRDFRYVTCPQIPQCVQNFAWNIESLLEVEEEDDEEDQGGKGKGKGKGQGKRGGKGKGKSSSSESESSEECNDYSEWAFEYEGVMDAPEAGWIGFVVELVYNLNIPGVQGPMEFRVSSDANIVPDILPFPGCGDQCI